ncbi:uncharacterized protein LOC129889172 isoform X2 [Solanum dulcamara]|uniref:uncharacterized protein LOC129889172 isoform X2 n=1 Tax=Solanum dulcamara TaxID=45834 RepID=UPI002486A62E|nr:uncharacterized protein LOC129889172 isoform X2 [Solanum dulcamara]
MDPLDRNKRNGEGINLRDGIGVEPLSMNQRNGMEGMNLSDETWMEPLSGNQRNGNLSGETWMEPLRRSQRNGEGMNLSDETWMEPLSRNQRNGEGMSWSDIICMEPLTRNQRNGDGMNLSDETWMEPLSRIQRNGMEGMTLSDETWMEPLGRDQTDGESMSLSDFICVEPLSRNHGVDLSNEICMEPLSRNQRNGDGMNLSDGIGMKRVPGGVEDDSVVKKIRLGEEFDEIFGSHKYTDENVALEKVKDEHLESKSQFMVFEKLDESIGHIGKMDILKRGGVKNGAVGAGEFIVGCQEGGLLSVPEEESHNAIQMSNWNLGNVNGGSELGFDFNVSVMEAANGSTLVGMLEDTQRIIELNEIRSDVSDHREERVNKGKAEQIEEIIPYVAFGNCKLELGVMTKDQDICGSSSLGGEKRYTREQKGKAKVDNTWLSLTTLPMELDLQHSKQQQEAVSTLLQLGSIQHRQSVDVLPMENAEVNLIAEHATRQKIALRERAPRFARFEAPHEGSSSPETKLPTWETIKDQGNTPDPFSTALKKIRECIPKRKDEKLVRREASPNPENKEFHCVFPSLLDLSLKTLAENAEAIVSLEGVPDILRRRLTELLCNSRKMSSHMLDLLIQGSPTQIRIKDCSWLTEEQFCNSFRDFDRRNLMVLQLDLCGQPTLDHVLGTTIAPASNSLPNLAILSLRGACRMSDRALETLVTSAPSLQSIDLSQCSLLTHTSIGIAANSLGSILKELCIDDCQSIDAIHILPSLEKMECLELLSVAGIHSVCDQFVSELLTARGHNIKQLDISRCQNLTDHSLKFIGDTCANLHSLNISNLSKLTDVGLQFLANGCRSIRKLIFCRNNFSDEGIAAFLEASGACLEELSLNNCSKITDVFINGHSNTVVQIIGLSMTQISDKISRFDGVEVLLKYSPVVTSSNS